MNRKRINSIIAVSTAALILCTFDKPCLIYAIEETNQSSENPNHTNLNTNAETNYDTSSNDNNNSNFHNATSDSTSDETPQSSLKQPEDDISLVIDNSSTDFSTIDYTMNISQPSASNDNINDSSTSDLEEFETIETGEMYNATTSTHIYYVSANPDPNSTVQDNDREHPMSLSQLRDTVLTGNCTVCFKRGDVFYEPLEYHTDNQNDTSSIDQGNTANPTSVTLTSYGDSNKDNPVFTHAKVITNRDDWSSCGNNIWKIDLATSDETDDDNRYDANNIGFIYDKEQHKLYGNKVDHISDLHNNFDFCTKDEANDPDHSIYVYCTSNPNDLISTIYLALSGSILSVGTNTTVDGLDFKYGGSHAISNKSYEYPINSNKYESSYVKNVTIKNCNIDYMGGSTQRGSKRLGNGIEFLRFGSDINILNNRISNCYDTATTLQGKDGYWDNVKIEGNTFIHNSQSFEIWSELSDINIQDNHKMNPITFSNNLCIEQGRGWGYDVRSDKDRACDIEIQYMHINNWNLNLNNNVFFNPRRVYYFDDTSGYGTNIENNLITTNNKFYLYPASENSSLLHSAQHQNSYDYDHISPCYMINLNIPYTAHNIYWNTTNPDFQHYADDLGEQINSTFIDVFSPDTYNIFADDYNKNTNDIIYKITDGDIDSENITASIEYVGSNSIADFSNTNDLSKDLENKVYVTSIKYPSELYGEPASFLPSSNINFSLPEDNEIQQAITKDSSPSPISVSKDPDAPDNTVYTWFKNNENSLKNAVKINSAAEDSSDIISDDTEKTSLTPSASTTGTSYYFCVATFTDNENNTITAKIIDAAKVTVKDNSDSSTPENNGDNDNNSGNNEDSSDNDNSDNSDNNGNSPNDDNLNNSSSSGSSHHSGGGSSSRNSSSSSSEISNINSSQDASRTVYVYKFDPDLNSLILVEDSDINKENILNGNNKVSYSNETYVIYEQPQKSLQNNAWNKVNNDKWCYIKDNTPVTGWIIIDNTKYHFNDKKIMDTGWIQDNNNWYYLNPNSDGTQGALQTGWIKDNNIWYYLDNSETENKGVMKTGWIKDKDTWYYLNTNGSMNTGWLFLDSQWYYLDSNGAMKTGWCKINNKWYYFYSNGSMASNTSIDGYKLGNDGALK